jgi:hypothetical protein
MDEKTTGLIRRNGHAGGGEVARLTQDIDAIRSNLDGLIDELDRRRRAAMDFRLQVRRHPLPFVIGVVAVAALIGGGIALAVARQRRRARLTFKIRRVSQGLRRLARKTKEAALQAAREDHDGAGRKAGRLGLKLLAAGSKITVARAARGVRKGRAKGG